MRKYLTTIIGLSLFFISTATFAQTPVNCAKSRVSFITDSHGLGPMGKSVGTWLMKLPEYQQRLFILGGSSPLWWMNDQWADKYPNGVKSPLAISYDSCAIPKAKVPTWEKQDIVAVRSKNIELLLPAPTTPFEHDLVILEQGTNIISAPSKYKDMAKDLVLRIRKQSPNSTCIWIGPPDMRNIGKDKFPKVSMASVYKYIAQGLMEAEAILKLKFPNESRTACHLIDSRKYSKYPPWEKDYRGTKVDGTHYPFAPSCTEEETKANPVRCRDFGGEWGQGVVEEIKEVMNKELTTPGEAPLVLPDSPCPGDENSTFQKR